MGFDRGIIVRIQEIFQSIVHFMICYVYLLIVTEVSIIPLVKYDFQTPTFANHPNKLTLKKLLENEFTFQ